jgi:hypothetical protein
MFIYNIMGSKIFDKYSLLHLSVGIVSFYWGLSLWVAIVVHTLFEIFENTMFGINIIDTYFTKNKNGLFGWPGGKKYADSLSNNIGDTISFIVGWCIPLLFWTTDI